MLIVGVIISVIMLALAGLFLFNYDDDNKYMDEDKNKNNCSMIDYEIANKLGKI